MKETRSSETASSAPQSGLRALVGSVFTGDRVLWIIIAALAVISVLVVYSSTAKMAYDAHTARSTAHFLRQQVGILILCVPIIVIVHKINCRVYNRLAQPVYVLSLLLTLAVYFIGATTNGAARWIPVAGFQFQPSEALKVATILLLARRLSSCQSKIDRIRIVPSLNPFRWGRPAQRKIWREGTRPILLPVVLSCAVIFPAHTSSAMLVFLTSLVMMLIGRVRVSELVRLVGLACAALLLAGLLNLGRSETAGGRVSTWIDLWTSSQTEKPIDRLTDTERSMIAIHNGGILGEGAGQSAMRVEMIHPESDYAYAFFVEEYGIILAVVLLMLYLPGNRDIPPLRNGLSGVAGAGAGAADNVSGAAAHHGHGEPDSRDGADPAADLARRIVDALHDDRLRDDPERQPPERRTFARYAPLRVDL